MCIDIYKQFKLGYAPWELQDMAAALEVLQPCSENR